VLEREYGPYIVPVESGYDFSVQVDLENLPEDQGTWIEEGQLRSY
jgi:actin related protein 2/3 complex subunit 2